MKKIILASTSQYRKRLMKTAGFEVICAAPEYEEKSVPGLRPLELIAHHARGKALSVALHYPDDIVIGSDQGLVEDGKLLGKPGSVDGACAQLAGLCGKTAILATSLTVLYDGIERSYQDRAMLHFRSDLNAETIRRYVEADMPLDCAGSFMIESRGSRLFTAIECDDPTAIQGLPMMRLNAMIVAAEPRYDGIF